MAQWFKAESINKFKMMRTKWETYQTATNHGLDRFNMEFYMLCNLPGIKANIEIIPAEAKVSEIVSKHIFSSLIEF